MATKKLVFLLIVCVAELRVSESTTSRKLRIAVPISLFPQFVKFQNGDFTGFSIGVFKEAWTLANISFDKEFFQFHGTYHDLVESVGKKEYDAGVGDVQVLARRLRSVDFTVPYLASGISMIVPQKQAIFQRTWILNVFTVDMWAVLVALHISTALVAALIEVSEKDDTFAFHKLLRLWLSLLFYSEREPLESDVGRYIYAVWKIVIAVIVAIYYAALTSSLTVSRLIPSVPEIGNATVGCNQNSFICYSNYLRDVLHIEPKNITRIKSLPEYVDAFDRLEIKAAYFIEPHARVFLKMYGKKFIEWGTPQHLGGLAFVFQKGSPFTANMSVAISGMLENGTMGELEKKMIDSLQCKESLEDRYFHRIEPNEFVGLLIVAAIGLTLGCLIVVGRVISKLVIRKKPLLPLLFRKNSVVELSPSFRVLS